MTDMAIRIIQYLIPERLSSRLKFEFQASGSILSSLNERSKDHRASVAQRATSTSFILHSFLFLFISIPALLILLYIFTQAFRLSLLLVLLPGPLLKLLDMVWKSAVPVVYLLFPPTVEDWEDLTESEDWKQNERTFPIRVPFHASSKTRIGKFE